MNGKEKCKILKQLRKEIASQNNILYTVEECPHKGECKGTCPKCEAEVKYLEQELAKRHKAGLAVVLATSVLAIPFTIIAANNYSEDQNAEHNRNVIQANSTEISGAL